MTGSTDARRRDFLRAALGLAAASAAPRIGAATATARMLRASEARQALVGAAYPETEIWGYDGSVPGPLLRYRQGERLRVEFENALPEPTTVHFHGIRLPNAMDGVPYLTQPPIAPGARFVYEFDLPDAGTYWYHPHLGSHEQVARGLSGALIIEEDEPHAV
ncbi:MAG: multicopper oxidase domain-containing protein, partial [Burkholderiales bacterium]